MWDSTFYSDDLTYGVIVTRDGLECHHLVEFEYCNNPKSVSSWVKPNLCAYYVGSSGAEGTIDEHLSIEWKSVIPVCRLCRAYGALPLAIYRKINGVATERRTQHTRLASSQDRKIVV